MGKKKTSSGTTALAFSATRLGVARVLGGERPVVDALDTYEVDAADRPAALQRLRKQMVGEVSLVLSPGEYQLLQVDAPELTGDELKSALRWKIKDMIDYPPDQATLDVFDLRLEGPAATRGRQCFVAAASNRVLEPKIQMFQEAKAPLSVIDIPDLAQRNVARLFEAENRGLALLNFSSDGGMLTFTSGGELFVVRRIEITLEQLEAADEARRTDLYDRVALEVQRSIDNFERLFNFITVARLVAIDLPSVPGLFDYLKGYVSVKTEAIDLATVLDFPAIPELRNPRRQAECLTVIGAALREATA